MTPLQAAKWQAYRHLQPDPHERICDILKRGFAILVSAWGGECDENDLEPYLEKKRVEKLASPDQMAAVASMALGANSHGNSNR